MDIFASVRSKGGAVRDHPAIGSVRDDQIFGGHFAVTSRNQLKLDLLAFVETGKSGAFNGTDVHERILGAVLGLDETKTLGRVEPFDSTCSHDNSFHDIIVGSPPNVMFQI